MKSIAFFNNKGGVGKTTLLCNLAGYLALRCDKNVLVIDTDPQCNTTTYVLGDEYFYSCYSEKGEFSVASLIPTLEDGEGYVKEFKVKKTDDFGFDIIPGNPKFAASEDFLASEWRDVKSSEIRGIKSTLLFTDFLSKCGSYDYVFFDMGPSLGAINRVVLLACDYFITPMSSDAFSLLALNNIGTSLSSWRKTLRDGYDKLDYDKKKKIDNFENTCSIRFIGYVEQQYISKSVRGQRRPVRAYDEILQKIPTEIAEKIVFPVNEKIVEDFDYKIGSIPNFHSLVPMSQTAHKPIFELSTNDGVVGAHYQKVKEFESLMKEVTERMLHNMEALND